MARQPAPAIDPRDPFLRGVKDFLLWLYQKVPTALETIDDHETRITTLEDAAPTTAASAFLYEFSHIGQNVSSTTRRLWNHGGFHTTAYTSVRMTWIQRVIPYNGTLKRLITRHPAASVGGSNTITYTVYKSTDNGASWSSTALSTAVTASDDTIQVDTSDVSVSANDMIMVEATFSGAVTQDPSNSCMYAAVWYEKT